MVVELCAYKQYVNHDLLQQEPRVQQYKEKVNAASVVVPGLPQYAPGIDIYGAELRDFVHGAAHQRPLVCQLCNADF